jgi:hypothetical protein
VRASPAVWSCEWNRAFGLPLPPPVSLPLPLLLPLPLSLSLFLRSARGGASHR